VNDLTRKVKEPDITWWEYLNWETMPQTWALLSEDIKQVIRDAGLAPSFDSPEEKVTEE